MGNRLTEHLVRGFRDAALTIAILLAVAACSGDVERRWLEEVDIGDGAIVKIGRYSRFKESHSLAGDVYSVSDSESIITFKDEHAHLPEWRAPLVPLVLYRDGDGEWVIVATADNCDVWDQRGKPLSMYWEFRLKGDAWTESALSEGSAGRKANLLFLYDPPIQQRMVTMEMKNRVLATNNFAKWYESIDAGNKSTCR